MTVAIALGAATLGFAFAAYASHHAAKAYGLSADVHLLVARMLEAPDKQTADALAAEYALANGVGIKPKPVKPAGPRRWVG